MSIKDFLPEEEFDDFENLSDQSQRILRAASAQLQLGDEALPLPLDSYDLNTLIACVLTVLDISEYLKDGQIDDYLHERWSDPDKTGILVDDQEKLVALFRRLNRAEKTHPATVEARKRVRGH